MAVILLKAPVVGKLLPTATGVVELEQDGNGWMRVRQGEIEGWVNHRYLRPEYPLDGSLPSELTCSGFEPTWSATLTGGRWGLSDPSALLPARIVPQVARVSWLVTSEPGLTTGGEFLIVQTAPEGESDGASSHIDAYRAAALVYPDTAMSARYVNNGVCHIPNEAERARR